MKKCDPMKKILYLIVSVLLAQVLSELRVSAQPVPDGYEWIYGCWKNPETGDVFIIGQDGIRETRTRGWVCECFLGIHPSLDVHAEPLKPYEFTRAFDKQCLLLEGDFGYDAFIYVGNRVLYDQGKAKEGVELVRIKAPAPGNDIKRRKENRALGRWELGEGDGVRLDITETHIRRTENGETHPYDYSLSEEGYLITYDDLYVFDKGVLHHYFSNTEFYIISTFIRPAGTAIPSSHFQ